MPLSPFLSSNPSMTNSTIDRPHPFEHGHCFDSANAPVLSAFRQHLEIRIEHSRGDSRSTRAHGLQHRLCIVTFGAIFRNQVQQCCVRVCVRLLKGKGDGKEKERERARETEGDRG